MALYNEIEPFAVEWLRNLIAAGHIAPGVADDRSIKELAPADVVHHEQAHFFAGIGVWSHALRSAGWPDDAEVWTGSCPCQPFSGAGQGGGFADPRHLWPTWFELIRKHEPPIIFGEQVASPDGLTWLDLVQTDLEGAGYAFAAFDLSGASVGAPHIRQRLYFVAIRRGARLEAVIAKLRARRLADEHETRRALVTAPGLHDQGEPRDHAHGRGHDGAHALAHDARARWEGEHATGSRLLAGRADGSSAGDSRVGNPTRLGQIEGSGRSSEYASARSGWLGSSDDGRARAEAVGYAGGDRDREHARELPSDEGEHEERSEDGDHAPEHSGAHRPTAGFWRECEWVACREPDGGIVFRPVEPGTFPLAHGATARVGRLRAYGNTIIGPLAQTFIEAVIEFLLGY